MEMSAHLFCLASVSEDLDFCFITLNLVSSETCVFVLKAVFDDVVESLRSVGESSLVYSQSRSLIHQRIRWWDTVENTGWKTSFQGTRSHEVSCCMSYINMSHLTDADYCITSAPYSYKHITASVYSHYTDHDCSNTSERFGNNLKYYYNVK